MLASQKTSSLPISPRIFDSAKFGSNQKKSQGDSYDNNNMSAGPNYNSNSGIISGGGVSNN